MLENEMHFISYFYREKMPRAMVENFSMVQVQLNLLHSTPSIKHVHCIFNSILVDSAELCVDFIKLPKSEEKTSLYEGMITVIMIQMQQYS